MKLSQIHSKDRAMHEGDKSSFWDELINLLLFFTDLFIFVFLSKYQSTYLLG
jgi:hypothetical protein